MRKIILAVFCFILFPALASGLTVNRLNGGGTVVYVDFSIPGDVMPLELSRTYHSITAVNEAKGWNGAFGWGWTAAFESILTVTPERHVLLRDGHTGNTVIFRPSKEDPKAKKAFFDNLKKAYHTRKLGREVSAKELASLKLPDKMRLRLASDPQYRIQMAVQYNLKGEIPKGKVLVSTKYGYQTMQFENNQWIRKRNGYSQVFDLEGRLIRQEDKSGFFVTHKYFKKNKHQLKEISSRNNLASLRFEWKNGKVASITDNQGRRSRYFYDAKGNLVKAVDSKGQTYVYKYENVRFPHLLTRILYPNESTKGKKVERVVQYNRNGLVIYHKAKTGAVTKFSYGKKTTDPANSFWTKTAFVTKRDPVQPNERYEEFFLKKRPNGTKYLYKQETRNTYIIGRKRTTIKELIVFTECCGKPSQIVRNGQVTKFKYFANGLLKEKRSPRELVKLEYDPKWMKVSRVERNGKVSQYEYDRLGNLVKASNSSQKSVKLKYDRLGRISNMVDVKGGRISFQYGTLGKPILIGQKGVGTIRISYNRNGAIRKTETVLAAGRNRKPSAAESKQIIRKVMTGFQNLLDIIRPAAQVNKASPLAWRGNE